MTSRLRHYDDNGWLEGAVEPFDGADAYTLLSPERESRIVAERWQYQAQKFFGTDMTVWPTKSYAAGGWPQADCAVVTVGQTRVELITLPADRAAAAIDAAHAAAAAIGGAGFDVLVGRTQRVWQVATAFDGPDDQAPLRLAAMLASLLLAPIVPPGGGTIFGVKGARERLKS